MAMRQCSMATLMCALIVLNVAVCAEVLSKAVPLKQLEQQPTAVILHKDKSKDGSTALEQTPSGWKEIHQLVDTVEASTGYLQVTTNSNHCNCPPWFTANTNSCDCVCGNTLHGIIYCSSNRTFLSICYCMSFNGDVNNTVVGACLYTCKPLHSPQPLHYPIPSTTEELNKSCSYVNRDGQLCGSCKDGFVLPVYSYDLKCINSTACPYSRSSRQWAKYFAVSLLPLTLFYMVVVSFRVSAVSPQMEGFVFTSQVITISIRVRHAILGLHVYPDTYMHYILSATESLLGIWNLDFFRTLYHPFCVHPGMTTLQTAALDYIVAVYPLVLIIVTYFLVELHSQQFCLIVWVWKPIHKCLARFRQQWNIRTSLIETFATFLLLSYTKFLSVSFDLLYRVRLYDMSGKALTDTYLYADGTVKYFGKEHIPYGILAVAVVVVFNIFPLLLLCLYPCRCFQRCLNHCGLQSRLLHTLMDAFQGGYKNGTNGTRDCRYFAAVYMIARIAVFLTWALSVSNLWLPLLTIIFITLTTSIALIQPYKASGPNLFNTLLVFAMALGTIFFDISSSTLMESPNDSAFWKVFAHRSTAALVGIVIPGVYITGLLLHWVFVRKGCWQLIKRKIQYLWKKQRDEFQESFPHRLIRPSEYESKVLPDQLVE